MQKNAQRKKSFICSFRLRPFDLDPAPLFSLFPPFPARLLLILDQYFKLQKCARAREGAFSPSSPLLPPQLPPLFAQSHPDYCCCCCCCCCSRLSLFLFFSSAALFRPLYPTQPRSMKTEENKKNIPVFLAFPPPPPPPPPPVASAAAQPRREEEEEVEDEDEAGRERSPCCCRHHRSEEASASEWV